MRVGIIVPQGWTGEYDGWDASRAWARTVAVAHETEALGFDSLWLFDHLQTEPVPTDEITFEAFVALSALAVETARVRLGHLVLCAGYRNPALVAKMISTLDVVSGGRAELGLGAGWKEDEYVAYGFGFPPLRARMEMLEDALEIATRMLGGGRATYEGPAARVHDAINVPRGLQQPRVPILVGGNGPNRTWRLAARFADELNLDWFTPEEIVEARPVIDVAVRGDRAGPADAAAVGQHRARGLGGRGRAAGGPAATLRRRGGGPRHDARPGVAPTTTARWSASPRTASPRGPSSRRPEHAGFGLAARAVPFRSGQIGPHRAGVARPGLRSAPTSRAAGGPAPTARQSAASG